MKVLMMSGDAGVLNPSSPAGKRTEEYRKVLGDLDILLCYGSVFSFVAGLWRGFVVMRQKKVDVITSQSLEHWLLAWLLSRFFSVPWQMQIHTDIFSPYFVTSPARRTGGSVFNKIRVLLAKFLLPRANGVRVVSQRVKESLLRTINYKLSTDVAVLSIFVEVEKIKATQVTTDLHKKYPQYDFIILMASRLTSEKNIGLAIRASASLIRANRRIGLLIVGEGPEKEGLQLMTNDYGLSTNAVFEPWTGDLVSYYKTADLFLLTSNYEGYGMTIIEAAAAGCKIISSDVGIAPEILEKENIFKVGDADDLTAKLQSAIAGNAKPAKPLPRQTKEEYLRLYKDSLEKCLKK